MATQLTTSTQAAALGYAPQNKVAELCDGSLIYVDESGTSTNTARLYRVTNPSGTPSTAQVTGFAPAVTSMTQSVCDIFVLNTGTTSSEVWIALGGQAGAAAVHLLHATFTASGATWSSWDGTTVPGVGATTGDLPSLVWTGTYLIVAWRDNVSSSYSVHYNYTTDHTGLTGWQASSIKLNTDAGTGSHHYVTLHYDATLGATIALMVEETGANGTELLAARVLPDTIAGATNAPSTATKWGPETAIPSVTGINVGAGSVTSYLDHTTGRLHVAWCDSVTGSGHFSPGYASATITIDTTTITNNKPVWGTAMAAATVNAAAAQPTLTVDGAGKVFLFWETAAVNAAGGISYVTIPGPSYTTPSSALSVSVPTGVTAQYYPHTPKRARVTNGYIPLLYQTGTTSAYGIEYDNAIPAGTAGTPQNLTGTTGSNALLSGAVTISHALAAAVFATAGLLGSLTVANQLQGAVTTRAAMTGTLNAQRAYAGTLIASPALQGALAVSHGLAGTTVSGATVSGTLTAQQPLGGAIAANPALAGALQIGSIAAGTGIGPLSGPTTQTFSWYGGGSGTGNGFTYSDAKNGGWQLWYIPTYGGAIWSPWMEVNNGTAGVQQTALTTSTGTPTVVNPDGWTHMLAHYASNVYASQAYAGSETYPYDLTELAPAGTDFRRGFHAAVNHGTAVGGLVWAVDSYVYPGDPGFIVDAIAITNPSSTTDVALTGTDALELVGIGGLQQADSAGVHTWDFTHAYYGTKGNASATQFPASNVTYSSEPDYIFATPSAASGMTLGVGAVKAEKLGAGGFGWTGVTISAQESTNRMKLVWYGGYPTFARNTTQTYHVLRVLKRGLTAAHMAAISADFLTPGTPTTTAGTFTAFRVGERAYEFAASGNRLIATLDMTGATVRYKPIIKITGWTASAPPRVSFGGGALATDVDYRSVYDAVNQTLYLQLYKDIVTSAPASGQVANAALDVAMPTPVALSGITASASALVGALRVAHALAPSPILAFPSMSGVATVGHALRGASSAADGLAGTLTTSKRLTGALTSGPALSGMLTLSHLLSGTTTAAPSLAGMLHSSHALSGTITGSPVMAATPTIAHAITGSLLSAATMSGRLSVGFGIAGTLTSAPNLHGALTTAHQLAGTLPAAAGTSGTLHVIRALGGAVLPQPGMAGAVTANKHLAGTTATAAAHSSVLTVAHSCAGTVVENATLTGDLTVTRSGASLSGALRSSPSTQGAVTIAHHLAGTVAATGAMDGGATIAHTLSGAWGANPGLVGSLTLVHVLRGTTMPSAPMTGALTTPHLLTGAVLANPALTGVLAVHLVLHAPSLATASDTALVAIDAVDRTTTELTSDDTHGTLIDTWDTL